MGVGQVAGAIRSGHDAGDGRKEDANEDREGGRDVGIDLIKGRPALWLYIDGIVAVRNKLAVLEERRTEIVEEDAAGQALDAAHYRHVIVFVVGVADAIHAKDVVESTADFLRAVIHVHIL